MADHAMWDMEGFEPEVKEIVTLPQHGDRWEGEDEQQDVKDNWDDEEEETKIEPTIVPNKPTEKKKGKLKVKIEEKTKVEQLQPEDALAEKLRLQKLQEEADLHVACETSGEREAIVSIDMQHPETRNEFIEFENALRKKITLFEKSPHYVSLLESLFRDVCISLDVDNLKKVTSTLNVLCNEKQKADKEKKLKSKKKKTNMPGGGGFKVSLKNDFDSYGVVDDSYREYDDFM
uniref:Eukaryotic translation initiation factor 3 subunit J n=1 Tax=Eptatretus burgeri TaxID=7764 RepID=A0A8C4N3K3_EPTBU